MEAQEQVNAALAQMLAMAKARFGPAVQSYWFYDGDGCPGCQREIDALRYKGRDALSLNAFIYRKRSVLIGYVLCRRCATFIFREAAKHPRVQTPLHGTIEVNLSAAYERYRNSLRRERCDARQ